MMSIIFFNFKIVFTRINEGQKVLNYERHKEKNQDY